MAQRECFTLIGRNTSASNHSMTITKTNEGWENSSFGDQTIHSLEEAIYRSITREYPIEASIASYYAVITSITAVIFHGEDKCGLCNRLLSLLLFFTFASIPIIYELYSAIIRVEKAWCKTILKIVAKTLILTLFFVTIEDRPWSCYMDDDIILLNMAVIGVFIFCYIVHSIITSIKKQNQK